MAARVKGASLISTIAILREVIGPSSFQELVSACPPQTQQLIRRTLVAVEWVSLEDWVPFMQAAYERICRHDERQFRRLLRAVCKRDFSTVYRVYLAQATPQLVLHKAPSIWSAYFDSGTLLLAESGPDGEPTSAAAESDKSRYTLQMRDLATSSTLYAMVMHAYLEQLLIMAGAPHCTIQRAKERLLNDKLSCDFIILLGS